MKSTIIPLFIFIAIILFYTGFGYAELNLDFVVPAPKGAELADSKDIFFGGRKIKNALYKSTDDQPVLAGYYEGRLTQEGFVKIKDTANYKKATRSLKFKKEGLVVNIYLKTKAKETQITVSKYMEPPGSIPLEKAKLSIKDSFFAQPDKDIQGEDSSLIPRPPQSVRIAAGTGGRGRWMYTSHLSVDNLRGFYKSQMPNYSWQLEKEYSLKEGLDFYKRRTGKSIASIKLMPDSEDIAQVITDAYNLYFKGANGFAEIIIFPDFIDRKRGCIVTINLQ